MELVYEDLRRLATHRMAHERVDLEDCDLVAPRADDELLAVDERLGEFAKKHPLQAEVVKLRYFGGRTNEEVEEVLDISVSTVKNYWAFSRAWLLQAIRKG